VFFEAYMYLAGLILTTSSTSGEVAIVGFSFTGMEKKMRNDSGTSEGRKREIEIKIIDRNNRERKRCCFM